MYVQKIQLFFCLFLCSWYHLSATFVCAALSQNSASFPFGCIFIYFNTSSLTFKKNPTILWSSVIFRSSSPSLLVHTPSLLFLFQTKAVMLFFRLLTGHHILILRGHCATSCNGECWRSLTSFIPQVWSEFFLEPVKNVFKKYFCRCVDKAFVLWNRRLNSEPWENLCRPQYWAYKKSCREALSEAKGNHNLRQTLSSDNKCLIWVIAAPLKWLLDLKLTGKQKNVSLLWYHTSAEVTQIPIADSKVLISQHLRTHTHTHPRWGKSYCFILFFAKSFWEHCDSYLSSILAQNNPGPFKSLLSQFNTIWWAFVWPLLYASQTDGQIPSPSM